MYNGNELVCFLLDWFQARNRPILSFFVEEEAAQVVRIAITDWNTKRDRIELLPQPLLEQSVELCVSIFERDGFPGDEEVSDVRCAFSRVAIGHE